MTLPKFTRIPAADDILNRVQDRLTRVLDPLSGNIILDGRFVTASLTNGAFSPVSHGLDRVPTGYIVVRRSADAQVWDFPDGADSATFLWLQSSAAVTVTLWVF